MYCSTERSPPYKSPPFTHSLRHLLSYAPPSVIYLLLYTFAKIYPLYDTPSYRPVYTPSIFPPFISATSLLHVLLKQISQYAVNYPKGNFNWNQKKKRKMKKRRKRYEYEGEREEEVVMRLRNCGRKYHPIIVDHTNNIDLKNIDTRTKKALFFYLLWFYCGVIIVFLQYLIFDITCYLLWPGFVVRTISFFQCPIYATLLYLTKQK